MVRSACQRTGSYFVLGCRGKCIYFDIIVYICFVELVIWDVHQNISFFLCFYQSFDCCIQVCSRFIYALLTGCPFGCCCKIIFCFFQFCFQSAPAVFCIVIFVQCFCFCDRCFQLAGIAYRCCGMDIICGYVDRHGCIRISQCINSYGPFSGSVFSCRQVTTHGICQSKLNSHGFVHPVISCKFGSVSCQWGIPISVVGPNNRLHLGSHFSVVFFHVHTDEVTIAAGFLYYRSQTCAL